MDMNAAHWHLITNHIPIIGSFFISLLLVIGLIRKSDSLITTSYGLFILLGVFTFVAISTGGKAAGYLSTAGMTSDDYIKPHAEAAHKAALVMYATAVLSLIALLIKSLRTNRFVPVLILLVSLAGFGLLLWTGSLGGEIMHKETRPGFTSAADSTKKE